MRHTNWRKVAHSAHIERLITEMNERQAAEQAALNKYLKPTVANAIYGALGNALFLGIGAACSAIWPHIHHDAATITILVLVLTMICTSVGVVIYQVSDTVKAIKRAWRHGPVALLSLLALIASLLFFADTMETIAPSPGLHRTAHGWLRDLLLYLSLSGLFGLLVHRLHKKRTGATLPVRKLLTLMYSEGYHSLFAPKAKTRSTWRRRVAPGIDTASDLLPATARPQRPTSPAPPPDSSTPAPPPQSADT